MKASKLTRRATLLVLTAVLLFPFGLSANNLRIVGTPQIAKKNDHKTAAITFTVAWDNSWKASKPANYDAVWIYVKCWDGDQWNHVYLTDTGHVAGNVDMTGYYVSNRDGSSKKLPMTIENGKSEVYRKWHLDPAEKKDTGVVGVFLYRKDSLGAGNVMVPGVTLLWNYVSQGFAPDDDLVVKVFAVEMVYIPQGAFYLGGIGTAGNQPSSFTYNSAAFGYPYYVTSDSAITLASNAQAKTLYATGGIAAGTLPADFPKGYKAFYIMKYELTQEAYADFLNTLNQGQQNGRTHLAIDGKAVGTAVFGGPAYRNYIEISQMAPTVMFGVDGNNNNKWNETTTATSKTGSTSNSCAMGIDGQDIAMNWISMYDLLAYADFAGLRPMTEMEYEKACRGSQPPVADEYAWGSTTKTFFGKCIHNNGNQTWYAWNTAALVNACRGDETTNGVYNCGGARTGYWLQEQNNTQNGSNWWWWRWRNIRTQYSAPLRVGCFATDKTVRAASGASYWGVMNMSDNVSELCISLAAPTVGGKFTGVHGDGQLSAVGDADVAGWNMTTAWNYYIPRGMVFPSPGGNWTGWTSVYGSGGRPTTDPHTPQMNSNITTPNGKIEAGMVSSRAMAGHGVAGNTRVYTQFMPGIRCVRTAKASK